MSGYAQGGRINGETPTIRIRNLGPCALCGAPLIEVDPPNVHIEHVISAQDARDQDRAAEIMRCPGEEDQR